MFEDPSAGWSGFIYEAPVSRRVRFYFKLTGKSKYPVSVWIWDMLHILAKITKCKRNNLCYQLRWGLLEQYASCIWNGWILTIFCYPIHPKELLLRRRTKTKFIEGDNDPSISKRIKQSHNCIVLGDTLEDVSKAINNFVSEIRPTFSPSASLLNNVVCEGKVKEVVVSNILLCGNML